MLEQPDAALVDVEAGVGGLVHVSGHSASRRGRGTTLVRCDDHPDHDLRRAESLDEELLEAETVDVETYLTDARRIERIDEELRTGFAALAHVGKAVSIFGSARTPPGHPEYEQRARAGAQARRGRLRDHHRRRAGGHGGGQPRREGGRRRRRSGSTSSCRTSSSRTAGSTCR